MARLNTFRVVAGPTNTTDAATAVSIVTFDCAATTYFATAPNDVAFLVTGVLIGKVTTAGGAGTLNDSVTIQLSRTFRNIAGTVTARAAATTVTAGPIGDAAIVGCVGVLDVSGTSIRMTVNGIALNTISWTGHLDIYSGEFTG